MLQDDAWFVEWMAIIDEVLSSFDFTHKCWVQLPFAGGLYTQDKTNSLTWEVWTSIIKMYIAEKRKQVDDAEDNT